MPAGMSVCVIIFLSPEGVSCWSGIRAEILGPVTPLSDK